MGHLRQKITCPSPCYGPQYISHRGRNNLKNTQSRNPKMSLGLTQMRSCVTTTLPLRLARCSALRPSPSPHVSLTCCRLPWASSRTTERRSSSAVALSSCWPRERSMPGSDARNRRCSYFARIQRSLSSLTDKTARWRHF